MKKKFFISVFFVIGALLVFFLVLKVYRIILEQHQSFAENLPISYTLPREDSNLISKKYRDKVQVNAVINSKARKPFVFMLYDNKYYLTTFKLKLASDVSLKELIKAEDRNVDRSVGYTYNIIETNPFYKFQYKTGPIEAISNIFMTVSKGPSKPTINTDSIKCFEITFKNFSIRYSEKGPIDIYVVKRNQFPTSASLPMNIFFIKNKDFVSVVIVTPKTGIALQTQAIHEVFESQ